MFTKAEQALYQELETLRYPEDIRRIEQIRHGLAAIRYKRMQKRWFSTKKDVKTHATNSHKTSRK